MQRQAIQPPVKPFSTIVALLIVSAALAGAPPWPPPEAEKDKRGPGAGADAEEASRREAERVIRGIEVEILRDGKWTRVERIEKPLLSYGDPTRDNDRGSVWGWGREGRPVALIELFQDTSNRTRWAFAICNTSGGNCAHAGRAPPGGVRTTPRPNSRTSPAPRLPGAKPFCGSRR